MKKPILASTILAAFSLAACEGGYAGAGYTPVVDTQAQNVRAPAGTPPRSYSADLSYCQSLAEQRSVLTAGAQGGALGTVVGAGTGALGGALRGGGNVAEGALIGAGIGLLTSGTYSAVQGNKGVQDITIGCLRDRGWTVLAR